MSNPFSEDPILTQPQWNAVLAGGDCCCEMPECPVPTQECQSIDSTIRLNGYLGDDAVDGEPVYRITRHSYSGSDPAIIKYERDTVLFVFVGGVDFSAGTGAIAVTTTGSTFDLPRTTTYEEPTTQAQAREQGQVVIDANLDFDDVEQAKGTGCVASTVIARPPGDLLYEVFQTKVRFPWVIPDTFQGSYLKVLWDILETPDDEDLGPSFYQSDITWTWTGPGNPADAESWKSGLYEIPPPTEPGTRRVVNGRAWHQRGPFGSLPTPFGEQVPRLDGELGGNPIAGPLNLGILPPETP